jgi:hypothetical protein
MLHHLWRKWRAKRSHGRNARTRKQRHPFKPHFILLEDRVLPSITVLSGFNGMNNTGWYPPDTNLAVGPTQVVEVVNQTLAIYNKSTGALVSQQSLPSLFSGFDTSGSTGVFDPSVFFDEQAGRFVVEAAVNDSAAHKAYVDFAFSNSADATLGFTEKHQIEVDQGGLYWADNGKIGWNADAYVYSGNLYTFANAANGSVVITISKSSALDQNNSTFTNYLVDRSNDVSMIPARMHGSATGGPMWFVETNYAGGNSIQVVRMDNELSATPAFTTTTITTTAYSPPPPAIQPGGTISVVDSRTLNAEWNNNKLVAGFMVQAGNDAAAAWVEFSTTGSAPTLVQQGVIHPAAGVSTYMPAVGVDAWGNLFMTYQESSSSELPSIYVTGWTPGDPSGTMKTPVRAVAGTAILSPARAGDYSGIALDPSSNGVFWAGSEYGLSGSSWGTWMASFQVEGILSGIAFNDLNRDGVYEAGEELPGVTITIPGVGSTVTSSTGNYSIPLPAGNDTVVAQGSAIATPVVRTIAMGTGNMSLNIETPRGDLTWTGNNYTQIDPTFWQYDVTTDIHIHSTSDVTTVRNNLINYIWSGNGLPTGLPAAVTQNVPSPLGTLGNLAGVDQLQINMDLGFVSYAYLFHPLVSNNKLIIFHQGHDDTLSARGGQQAIQDFLNHGYSVLAFFMPLYGPNTGPLPAHDHNDMANLQTATFNPIKIFLEPVIVGINYVKQNYNFSSIAMTGISGGGWTTTWIAALDPRVTTSVPVAGSLPIFLRTTFNGTSDIGDWEQEDTSLYNIASYEDLYILGSYGAGRSQLQVLNQFDNCCFAGVRFRTYEDFIKNTVANLGSGSYNVFLDDNQPIHEISQHALDVAMFHAVEGDNVQIADDGIPGDAGYTTGYGNFNDVGTWTQSTGPGLGTGLNGEYLTAAANSGAMASWAFTNLAPGNYKVWATWSPQAGQATNAPYTLLDGANTLATVTVDQTAVPADLNDSGAAWKSLGIFNVTSGILAVQLGSNANGVVQADGIRIQRLGSAPAAQLRDGPASLPSGQGSDNFSALLGTPEIKTFTVTNAGSQNLVLGSAITVPSGFSVATGFGATTIAPGQSTTFQLKLNATAVGSFSGTVSFSTNDPNALTYSFNVTGSVSAAMVIDDSSPQGYSTTGSWSKWTGQGFDNTVQQATTGTGSSVATWAFSASPGTYDIAVTWTTYSNRATNAPFTILDGTTPIGTVPVDQLLAPASFSDLGDLWQDLGQFVLKTNQLVVQLSNNANGYVIADAVRVVRVGTLPDVQVQVGATTIANGGSDSFGTTAVGTPVTHTYTVTNNTSQTLSLGPTISVPAGFTVVQQFGTNSLGAGQSTTFQVQLSAASAGAYSGTVSFATSDSNVNPFAFTVSGTVNATQIIDDSSSQGYSTTGSWSKWTGQGFDNTVQQSTPTSGSSVASWTFTVGSGIYDVAVTWTSYSNRATNAPYTVLNGTTVLGTVQVNQQVNPSSFTDAGAVWQDLGNFTITGNQLVVQLSNNANGYVIADAVRIQKVG